MCSGSQPMRVVIQKNYESKRETYWRFYLGRENYHVVVYESDKKTKYMSTGISAAEPSAELARKFSASNM